MKKPTYARNLEIFHLNNYDEKHKFLQKIDCGDNLDAAFNNFNDYNIDNYIACYIYVSNYNTICNKFDEELYNKYHKDYIKYYSANPNIKLVVYTNSKKSSKWCINFFKFFNTFYYYKQTREEYYYYYDI